MTTLSNKVISIYDKKTSMRLAKAEWNILDNICLKENIKRKKLLEIINSGKDPKIGLAPSVRLFSLLYLYYQNQKYQPLIPNKKATENIQTIINAMLL